MAEALLIDDEGYTLVDDQGYTLTESCESECCGPPQLWWWRMERCTHDPTGKPCELPDNVLQFAYISKDHPVFGGPAGTQDLPVVEWRSLCWRVCESDNPIDGCCKYVDRYPPPPDRCSLPPSAMIVGDADAVTYKGTDCDHPDCLPKNVYLIATVCESCPPDPGGKTPWVCAKSFFEAGGGCKVIRYDGACWLVSADSPLIVMDGEPPPDQPVVNVFEMAQCNETGEVYYKTSCCECCSGCEPERSACVPPPWTALLERLGGTQPPLVCCCDEDNKVTTVDHYENSRHKSDTYGWYTSYETWITGSYTGVYGDLTWHQITYAPSGAVTGDYTYTRSYATLSCYPWVCEPQSSGCSPIDWDPGPPQGFDTTEGELRVTCKSLYANYTHYDRPSGELRNTRTFQTFVSLNPANGDCSQDCGQMKPVGPPVGVTPPGARGVIGDARGPMNDLEALL